MLKSALVTFSLALVAVLGVAGTELVRTDQIMVAEATLSHSPKKGVTHTSDTLNVSVDLSNARTFTAAKDCKVTFDAVRVSGEGFDKSLPSRSVDCSGFGDKWNFQVPVTDVWSNEGDYLGAKCRGLSKGTKTAAPLRQISVDYTVAANGKVHKGKAVAKARGSLQCTN